MTFLTCRFEGLMTYIPREVLVSSYWDVGRSVDPIQTRGADYAPHTTTNPSGIKNLSTPLTVFSYSCLLHFYFLQKKLVTQKVNRQLSAQGLCWLEFQLNIDRQLFLTTLNSLIEEHACLDFSNFLSTLLAIFHVISEKFYPARLLIYLVNK